MTDRDHFAAAALTGLLVHANDDIDEETMDTPSVIAYTAYQMADAMLRERGNHPEKLDSSANHDAAPAARASAESVAPQPTAGDKSGNPTSHSGTGKQTAPPRVETDGFSHGPRTGTINRTPERQSPDRECGESQLRDVPRPDTKGKAAGGPEPSFSDRPKPVKDDDSDRSKPVAPAVTVGGVDRPVSYAETDQNRIFYDTKRDTTQPQNGALSGCETVPDPDSRVWETPRTPQPHATPPQGSVQGECSVRDSRNAKEPAAWAVMERDGFGIEGTFTDRYEAVEWCDNRQEIVPLYRHLQPTLTDEERKAIELFASLNWTITRWSAVEKHAATLRNLLERLGGER